MALFVELTNRFGTQIRVNLNAVFQTFRDDGGTALMDAKGSGIYVQETWAEIQEKANAEVKRLDSEDKTL